MGPMVTPKDSRNILGVIILGALDMFCPSGEGEEDLT